MPNLKGEPPRRVGRYEIEAELGRGVMGVVYKAHDTLLDRTVALKTIRLVYAISDKQQETFEQRFLAEARIAARLSHPGIVSAHDMGRDAQTGLLYIAFEYLVGRNLAQVISEGPRPEWREALRIVARVARALHHAHASGVIHRDIKPANVMLLTDGEPKIMDFGIAKQDQSQLTHPGELFGTPLYMSPEQALGQAVDARTDLFSLGSIAYALLTGQAPFAADSVPRILVRVIHQEPPWPSELAGELPEAVDYFVVRSVSKAPERRYSDGQSMAEDAQDVAAGRLPRHRRGWEMPERGQLTVAAYQTPPLGVDRDIALAPVAGGEAASPSAAAPPAEPDPSRRRGRRAPAHPALMVLLLGAALYYFAGHPQDVAYWTSLWRSATRLPGQSAPASTTPTGTPAQAAAMPAATASPAESEAAAGEDDAAAAFAPAALDGSPQPGEPPAPEPSPEPSLDPEPTPAPTSTPPPAPEAAPAPVLASPGASPRRTPAKPAPSPARFTVTFEHSLKAGVFRVWVDKALVIDERLGSQVTRKALVFESRHGTLQAQLRLRPGLRRIEVQVRWEKSVRTRRFSRTFKAGATQRLSVALRGKELTAVWR